MNNFWRGYKSVFKSFSKIESRTYGEIAAMLTVVGLGAYVLFCVVGLIF